MTVTDTLETLLKLTGGPAYSRGMDDAAKRVEGLAQAEARQKQSSQAVSQGLRSAGLSALIAGGEIAAAIGIVKQSIDTFAADEQQIFRTTVVLRNLGNSYPIERAQAFGAALQKTVAIDDEAVVALVGLEKRFGVLDSQIEPLARTIVDFSKATGTDLQEAGSIVGRALLGQTRGLRALGIEFNATGNRARDTATLMTKLNSLFGGAGAAERNTLAGSITAMKEALANFMSTVGDKLSTVLVPALNAVTAALDKLSQHPVLAGSLTGAAVGGLLGAPFGVAGPGAAIGAVIGGLIGLLPSRGNAAAQIGNGKGRLATEDTLKKVEANTQQAADALVKGVLGGPGTVARTAATARDFRLAFGA